MTRVDAMRGYGTFDFGLSAEQALRAASLHRDSIVIDLLFQGPRSPEAWTDELIAELEEKGTGDLFVDAFFLRDHRGYVLRSEAAVLHAAHRRARLAASPAMNVE